VTPERKVILRDALLKAGAELSQMLGFVADAKQRTDDVARL
jgi:hypothetical protein